MSVPTALRLLLWLALLGSMAPAALELARPLVWEGGPDPVRLARGALAALPALALTAGVGRTFLSVLPPGRPGGHRPSALPATWAASHLLGTLVLDLAARLEHGIGSVLGLGAAELALLAAVLVLALRLATSPGAPRPGPRPGSPPCG